MILHFCPTFLATYKKTAKSQNDIVNYGSLWLPDINLCSFVDIQKSFSFSTVFEQFWGILCLFRGIPYKKDFQDYHHLNQIKNVGIRIFNIDWRKMMIPQPWRNKYNSCFITLMDSKKNLRQNGKLSQKHT